MSRIPELRIQFTKRADGTMVLRCVRRDGSATWERHEKNAVFFSFHDLSHFAVETVLSFRLGFYGLLAEGWEIADTSGKGARGKLQPESVLVEHVVGLFDRERSGGVPQLTATEFNAQLQSMASDLDVIVPAYTDAELMTVRDYIAALHRQWAALAAGSVLELSFDRDKQ